jgi:hypothetical protein
MFNQLTRSKGGGIYYKSNYFFTFNSKFYENDQLSNDF